MEPGGTRWKLPGRLRRMEAVTASGHQTASEAASPTRGREAAVDRSTPKRPDGACAQEGTARGTGGGLAATVDRRIGSAHSTTHAGIDGLRQQATTGGGLRPGLLREPSPGVQGEHWRE